MVLSGRAETGQAIFLPVFLMHYSESKKLTQETADNFTLVQIIPDWQPADEHSKQQRAYFLYHAVEAQVRQNFGALIAKCKSGTLGKDVPQTVQQIINESLLDRLVKETDCVCIQQAFHEQEKLQAEPWLRDFIKTSLDEADAVAAEPGTESIFEKYRLNEPDTLIPDLFSSINESFGFDLQSPPAMMLQNLLESSAGLTRELLVLSLSQPVESLSRHLQMYEH